MSQVWYSVDAFTLDLALVNVSCAKVLPGSAVITDIARERGDACLRMFIFQRFTSWHAQLGSLSAI